MTIEKSQTLLVLPGLGETPERMNFFREATDRWKVHNIQPRLLSVDWKDEADFPSKLHKLDNEVEEELALGNQVSLLGVSAAGSLALSAFIERPEINKVVTVSSRINSKLVEGYPTLDVMGRFWSLAAADGVRWLEENVELLDENMRRRVMNTRALSGDTQVHPSMSYLNGAENVWMPPARNHIHAVSTTLTANAEVIIDFLKK